MNQATASAARGCVLGRVLAIALSLLAAGGAAGQSTPELPGQNEMQRFTGPRWSMILPDRDFEGGCVVGFLAFEFSPTGYFTFNNKIRGAWRIDELGNLKLRTRDGFRFTLIVEGNTLRPTVSVAFLSRSQIYQRCPE